ncbi:MAG: hypothetical protein KDN19_12735, partial [Verrucomicrobiae bacterium]|nr:hypothetical protein [Verrucomicrobiae bacterium]
MKFAEKPRFMTLHCQYIPRKVSDMRGVLILFFCLAFSGMVQAQDEQLGRDTSADWLEYYYLKPKPDEFVKYMKSYSQDGTLSNENARPALIGFISQVIRQNRDKLEKWFYDLSGLPPEHMQVLTTAMLYSRTKEADQLLQDVFGDQFEKQKEELPKILELQLDKPHTIDMIWGFFYATGSENAVRRLVWCFNFVDAPKDPTFAKVPEGFSPLYRELPEAAAYTILSNAERHKRVREICKKLYEDEEAL